MITASKLKLAATVVVAGLVVGPGAAAQQRPDYGRPARRRPVPPRPTRRGSADEFKTASGSHRRPSRGQIAVLVKKGRAQPRRRGSPLLE